jgi:signal transduction histidine kinase
VRARTPTGGSRLPDVRALVLPGVVAAVQVVGTTAAARQQPDARPLDAVGYLLLLAGPLALAWRRRFPEAVQVVVLSVTLAYQGLAFPRGPVFVALVIAFFTCAFLGRRWFAYAVLAVGYLGFVAALPALTGRAPMSTAQATALAAWLLVLVAVAEVARQRRAAARAGRLRALEEARSRQEQERRRASDERLDIARELHDVVAHSLSLINVQSGVALELADSHPEQARDALAAIKSVSRDALVEIQAVLDALRRTGEHAPVAPAATLADPDGLARRVRAAGLDVRFVAEGAVVPLPPRLDLAAARIVQEALTNVVRHADGAAAFVTTRYSPDALEVQVDDDGPGPRPGAPQDREDRAGKGIPGMRERARALGGDLATGQRPGGGFRVTARLPLAGPPGVGTAP